MSIRKLPLLLVAATLALLALPAPASASQPTVQEQIDDVIAHEGGLQTGPNEVTWGGGTIVLTIENENSRIVGTCPSGSYCVYSGSGYTGSRLQFTTCTTGNSVSSLPSVRSIANSRATGTVRAYNGSTLVLTVAPNAGANTIATVTTVSCS